MRLHTLFHTAGGSLLLLACAAIMHGGSKVDQRVFGKLTDGQTVDLYTLRNAQGWEATIMTYGGVLVSLRVPGRAGHLGDVVLGFDALDSYVKESPYFGALIGRYANRIGGAAFTLNGSAYKLAANDHGNALHGGLRGFDKVLWKVRHATRSSVELAYRSEDGEEGYPGRLDVSVTYTLSDSGALAIEYRATSDKDTILNLTNHSYFNLAGHGNILGHVLTIDANQFTPVDDKLIPTGRLADVTGTPMDFRTAVPIGARIDADSAQLRFGKGYDHNWVLNPDRDQRLPAITVYEPAMGRVMEVVTDQPGVQLYSGNFLDGSLRGKGGATYEHRSGLCLETQHYPDSPNHQDFPSTVLRRGEKYHTVTQYRFRVK